ncbi:MAG: hypothetical protein Kow0063_20230 [Anaerolineae bacterium]
MLERLLSILAGGGIHTPSELARRLDVPESLVEQMLADLARMGYLRSVAGGVCQASPGNPGPCADCPLAGTSAVCKPGGSQVWALTQSRLPSRRVSNGPKLP